MTSDIEASRMVLGEVITDSLLLQDLNNLAFEANIKLLFVIDHHGFVRITEGGPFIATSQEQLDAIINLLRSLRVQV